MSHTEAALFHHLRQQDAIEKDDPLDYSNMEAERRELIAEVESITKTAIHELYEIPHRHSHEWQLEAYGDAKRIVERLGRAGYDAQGIQDHLNGKPYALVAFSRNDANGNRAAVS